MKEIYFTGGEPFLHVEMLTLLGDALEVAPTTVLANGTLIDEATADGLVALACVWNRRYLFGFLYRIAPMLVTFLFFLPMGGAGVFGLKQAGPMFPLYVVLVNLPFGIVIALTASAIIGTKP